MFPGNYFANGYFAPTYFPPVPPAVTMEGWCRAVSGFNILIEALKRSRNG